MAQCTAFTKTGNRCLHKAVANQTEQLCVAHTTIETGAGPVVPGHCAAVKANRLRCTRSIREGTMFCAVHEAFHDRRADSHRRKQEQKAQITQMVEGYQQAGTPIQEAAKQLAHTVQTNAAIPYGMAYDAILEYAKKIGMPSIQAHDIWYRTVHATRLGLGLGLGERQLGMEHF